MLTADLTTPRKQRHTARRILARLVDEHQLTDLSYSGVRDYVAKRRPEIWAAAGKAVEDAYLPQAHEPGAEGEVDFAACGSTWPGVNATGTRYSVLWSATKRATLTSSPSSPAGPPSA